MRIVPRLVFAAALVSAGAAAPVHAGDCGASEHYTYDHGDCTDQTGSTFGVMERAYDESYHQGLDQAARSRSGGLEPTAPQRRHGFDTGLMARETTDLMSFAPAPSSPGVMALARLAPVSKRREFIREASSYLAAYDRFAPIHGYYPHFMPSAFVFSTEAAFVTLANDHFTSPYYPRYVSFALARYMMKRGSTALLSNAQKQQRNDVAAIIGVGFLVERERALRHHDRAALALVKSQARDYLLGFWHIDPARTRLDDFVCADRPQFVSCKAMQYVASQGTRGTANDALMSGR